MHLCHYFISICYYHFVLTFVCHVNAQSSFFQIETSRCSPFFGTKRNVLVFLFGNGEDHFKLLIDLVTRKEIKWLSRSPITGANVIPCRESSRETAMSLSQVSFLLQMCVIYVLPWTRLSLDLLKFILFDFEMDKYKDWHFTWNLYYCLNNIRHQLWLLGWIFFNEQGTLIKRCC